MGNYNVNKIHFLNYLFSSSSNILLASFISVSFSFLLGSSNTNSNNLFKIFPSIGPHLTHSSVINVFPSTTISAKVILPISSYILLISFFKSNIDSSSDF